MFPHPPPLQCAPAGVSGGVHSEGREHPRAISRRGGAAVHAALRNERTAEDHPCGSAPDAGAVLRTLEWKLRVNQKIYKIYSKSAIYHASLQSAFERHWVDFYLCR